jgi:hypothetical protein
MPDREPSRRLLERPVAWQSALIWVLALSLVAVAVPHGNFLAAFLVVMAAIVLDYGGRFLNSRRPGPTARLQESTLLPYSPETVWALIKPAEKAPLVDATIRRGYREPGSPDGVGERQVFEMLDGQTFTVETVEYEPDRRALVSLVSPAPKRPTRYSHTVQLVDGCCLYTIGFEIDLRRGQYILQRFKDSWHIQSQATFGRIREVLADAEGDRSALAVTNPPVVNHVESPLKAPPDGA